LARHQRLGGALIGRDGRDSEDIARADQFYNLAAAVGKQLVKHYRPIDELVDALGGITLAKQMDVLTETLSVSLFCGTQRHDRGAPDNALRRFIASKRRMREVLRKRSALNRLGFHGGLPRFGVPVD